VLPCLAFLNAQNDARLRDTRRELNAFARERSLKRGQAVHRILAGALRVALRRRVALSVISLTVAADFDEHAEREGLTIGRALAAWDQAWRFVYQNSPTLRNRIAQCPLCGHFFYRYRRNATFCSTQCALFRQLLARHKKLIAREIADELRQARAFKNNRRAEYGKLEDQFADYHKKLFAAIIRPVLIPGPHLSHPPDISDAEAFVVMWRLLFRSSPIREKVATCNVCGQVFVRYQARNDTCGRVCQMRRYRQRKATSRRDRQKAPAAHIRQSSSVRRSLRRTPVGE
jgi:hypothetical protein